MSSALSMVPLLDQDAGVSPTRARRRCSTTEKLQILAAATACLTPGELGALLRREGLYSSHLSVWRAAEQRCELRGPRRVGGPHPRPPIRRSHASPRSSVRWRKRRRARRDALVTTVATHGTVRPLRIRCHRLGVAPAT